MRMSLQTFKDRECHFPRALAAALTPRDVWGGLAAPRAASSNDGARRDAAAGPFLGDRGPLPVTLL